jgi:hypothetical protein
MKRFPANPFFILLLLIFASLQCFSQDRIILNSGDTIRCTINKVTRNHVFFSQNFNGISAKGKITKNNIREWTIVAQEKQQAFFPAWEPPATEPENRTELKAIDASHDRFRVSFTGGAAYLMGNTENAKQTLQEKGVHINDSEKYYTDLKLGYQAKSSVYFNAFGDYWLGALYHGFYTSAEITTPLSMDDNYMYYGKYGERYFVNFAGASIFSVSRYGRSKQLGLNSSFTIGPAFYRDEVDLLHEQVLIQGTSLATNLTIGLEYFIQPKISLSLESSLFSSTLKKINVTTGQSLQEVKLEKDNYENLSRLDLSLGLIFYW